MDGFTEEEVAKRAGTTTVNIRRLTKFGILEAGDGIYPRRAVLRARVVLDLDAMGIDANAIAQALATGDLSLGYVEVGGRRPPKVGCSFAELSEEIQVAKGLLLSERPGVDAAKVRHALFGGFAGSKTLEVHGQRMLDRAFDPGFRVPLQSQGRPHRGICGRGDRDADAAVTTQLQGAVEVGDGGVGHSGPYVELVREVDLS